MLRTLAASAAIILVSLAAIAQPAQEDEQIVFQFLHKGARPETFTITLHRDGRAAYESHDLAADTLDEREGHGSRPGKFDDPSAQKLAAAEAYKLDFQASPEFLKTMFDLAKSVNYFDGDFEFHKHALADMGRKTAAYTNGATRHETTWNWSQNESIDEFAANFQKLSNTLEYGQRLVFEHKYDKLSLDRELKAMEELASHDGLREVRVVAPVLKEIVADPAVMNIARQRASHILSAGLSGGKK
jgi:hypothetical protein